MTPPPLLEEKVYISLAFTMLHLNQQRVHFNYKPSSILINPLSSLQSLIVSFNPPHCLYALHLACTTLRHGNIYLSTESNDSLP
jgi:hypothetical protein